MTIIREKSHSRDFVILNKSALNDDNLSWQAKGLWAYLMGLPDDWKVNALELCNHSRNGRISTCNVLNELIENGYAKRTQSKGDNKRFLKLEWTVYETKQEIQIISPQTENSSTETKFEKKEEKPCFIENEIQIMFPQSRNMLAEKNEDFHSENPKIQIMFPQSRNPLAGNMPLLSTELLNIEENNRTIMNARDSATPTFVPQSLQPVASALRNIMSSIAPRDQSFPNAPSAPVVVVSPKFDFTEHAPSAPKHAPSAPNDVVVYSIDQLDLSEDDKYLINQKEFSHEILQQAIPRVLAWHDRENDLKALYTVIKHRLTWRDPQPDPVDVFKTQQIEREKNDAEMMQKKDYEAKIAWEKIKADSAINDARKAEAIKILTNNEYAHDINYPGYGKFFTKMSDDSMAINIGFNGLTFNYKGIETFILYSHSNFFKILNQKIEKYSSLGVYESCQK